jgi:hypothetical protein
VHARPHGKQQPGDDDGSSQPEGPKANWPELDVKPGQRDPRCRKKNDRDQENDDAQDARGKRLQALRGFGIGGFDLPVEKR